VEAKQLHVGTDQARLQERKEYLLDLVTDTNPGGYWENQVYNWFSGS
jgi:hypothetical protein